jgi:hypothetical protein
MDDSCEDYDFRGEKEQVGFDFGFATNSCYRLLIRIAVEEHTFYLPNQEDKRALSIIHRFEFEVQHFSFQLKVQSVGNDSSVRTT